MKSDGTQGKRSEKSNGENEYSKFLERLIEYIIEAIEGTIQFAF